MALISMKTIKLRSSSDGRYVYINPDRILYFFDTDKGSARLEFVDGSWIEAKETSDELNIKLSQSNKEENHE